MGDKIRRSLSNYPNEIFKYSSLIQTNSICSPQSESSLFTDIEHPTETEMILLMASLQNQFKFSKEKFTIFTNMLFYHNEAIIRALEEYQANTEGIENALDSIALRVIDSRKYPNKHIDFTSPLNKI